MIHKLSIYESPSFDPYYNLAVEKYLLDMVQPGQCILYLWQNENTVVIGSNQNAWKECRISTLEEDGGKLARRLSGGGAVFHDKGNLNFTFLMCENDYNIQKQLSVICEACAQAGIVAVPSGRNDVLTDGRKFSGNAFYHHQGKAYHHGTLLINADMEKMQKYLSPSKAKLESKGVASVRSRVVNLNQLSADLTCDTMKNYMIKAFERVYDAPADHITLQDDCSVYELQQRYASWDHLFGKPLPFSFSCEERFDWGNILLQLQVESGKVLQAKVYSDAMDHMIAPKLEQGLNGSRFTLDALRSAVVECLEEDTAKDICSMLTNQNI